MTTAALTASIEATYALDAEDADWRFSELRAAVERLWIDGEIADQTRLAAIDAIAAAQARRAMRAEIDHAATGRHAEDIALLGARDAQAQAWVDGRFVPETAAAWLAAGVLDPAVARDLSAAGVLPSSPILGDELHYGTTWARALTVTRERSVADLLSAWKGAA